jgi:phage terminase large subunit
MEFKFLESYSPLFYSDKTYFLISGGRASGKSTQAAAYFLILLMGDDFFRGVVSRYTQKSIKSSIYRDILDLAEAWGISNHIKIEGDELTNVRNGNMIITHAMKLQDGTMTAKGKGLAKVTHLLIDEATELPSEEEFIKLNDSFRTKGIDRKILIIFNPTTKRHWIHRRWYIDGQPNPKWDQEHEFIHTTYHDNAQNIDPKKIIEWERMKDLDIEYYNHHILGLWQEGIVGRIFQNWNIEEADMDGEYSTSYGLDFGFSNDPTTLIEVKKHNNKLYLKELIYETGLTNEDIAERMKVLGITRTDQIIADSAEPKSIETLRRLGFNIQKAYKGPDSIRAGINNIKQHEVYIHPDSSNLLDEYNLYCWKPGTDHPIDNYNHAMDAIRYALSKSQSGQYAFAKRNGSNPFDSDGDLKDPDKFYAQEPKKNYGYGVGRKR